MGMRKSLTIFIILELVMYMPLSPIGGLHFEIMFGSRSWEIQPRHFCMGCTFLLAYVSTFWINKTIRFLQITLDIHMIHVHTIPRSECSEKNHLVKFWPDIDKFVQLGKERRAHKQGQEEPSKNNIKGQCCMWSNVCEAVGRGKPGRLAQRNMKNNIEYQQQLMHG
jgi:hypothetical protein